MLNSFAGSANKYKKRPYITMKKTAGKKVYLNLFCIIYCALSFTSILAKLLYSINEYNV